MIKKILALLEGLAPQKMYKVAYFVLPKITQNIGLDITNPNQKRALICYLDIKGVNMEHVRHANLLQLNQMIHCFLIRGFCVDVCHYNETKAIEYLSDKKYNVLIGLGKVYKLMAKRSDIPIKISFVTENNPEVVKVKYQERYNDFISRHSKSFTKGNLTRDDIFDVEQFVLSNNLILMSSLYNAESFKKYFDRIWTINANAIINNTYLFNDSEIKELIPNTKGRFLWFGSSGFIHKGIDLLLDAFKDLSDLSIDFYGVNYMEKQLFRRLAPDNSADCGSVDVMTDEFIDKVVKGHCFVIFPSCSEGMSTAVCTCMAHGIIPLLTKESGFDPHPSIIELEDWRVDSLKQAIRKAMAMDDEEILKMRRLAYEYGQKQFSLNHFNERFGEIIDQII